MSGYMIWAYKEDGTPLTLEEISENIKRNTSTIPVWKRFPKIADEKDLTSKNDDAILNERKDK